MHYMHIIMRNAPTIKVLPETGRRRSRCSCLRPRPRRRRRLCRRQQRCPALDIKEEKGSSHPAFASGRSSTGGIFVTSELI
jgi:hypothetical protein